MTGEDSFIYDTPIGYVALMMAIAMLLCYSLGVFASRYYLKGQKNDNGGREERKLANDGITLLGFIFLLLSFTFSMSLSRYDARRTVIYEESNCIGTAILRADLYPDSFRTALRKDFKDYVESRIAYYESPKAGTQAIHRALAQSDTISGRIWALAVQASKEQPNIMRDGQMVPALNQMIDIANSRDAIRMGRVPDAIIYLLLISIFAGTFILGYDKKSLVVLALFTILTVMTIYTILDLDRPMQGLIRSDLTHSKIVKLREMF